MLEILNFRASFCYHLKYLLEFLQKSQTLQGILGIRITFVSLPAEMAL